MLDVEGNIWIGMWGGGVNKYDLIIGCYFCYLNDLDNFCFIFLNWI